MPPVDPTPLGDEMVHRLPERKFPQAPPSGIGATQTPAEGEQADADALDDAPEIAQRPALPDQSQQMAADIEEEDSDPVIDSGPGITDGPGRRPHTQRR